MDSRGSGPPSHREGARPRKGDHHGGTPQGEVPGRVAQVYGSSGRGPLHAKTGAADQAVQRNEHGEGEGEGGSGEGEEAKIELMLLVCSFLVARKSAQHIACERATSNE